MSTITAASFKIAYEELTQKRGVLDILKWLPNGYVKVEEFLIYLNGFSSWQVVTKDGSRKYTNIITKQSFSLPCASVSNALLRSSQVNEILKTLREHVAILGKLMFGPRLPCWEEEMPDCLLAIRRYRERNAEIKA